MAYFHTTVLDNQIKALPTVDTASGAIASFNTDLTENLVEVKCQIVAKQASGTPSPSNPLPITTYTEMNLSACGKNYFDIGSVTPITNRIVNNNDGTITVTTPSNIDYVVSNDKLSDIARLKVGQTYTLTFSTTGNQARIYLGSPANMSWYSGASKTVTQEMLNAYVTYYASGNNTTATISNAQFDLGSATAYDPYNGTTANIPFGQTVANGVLNVTTGVLEIKMLEVDMGNLTWTLAGSGRLNTSIAGVKLYGNTQNSQAKCSWYQVVNGNTVANVDKSLCVSFNNSNVCQVNDSDYNGGNPNDFRTAVTGQKIIYELQTPIEIQLDSITLQALLNENNIWCDTGDTEVKFLLTVGKKIS